MVLNPDMRLIPARSQLNPALFRQRGQRSGFNCGAEQENVCGICPPFAFS